MTRKEVIARYIECEKRGVFDEHVDPVDPATVLPVDENFPFIPQGMRKFKVWLDNTFIVNPYTLYENKAVLKTKVVGRENLKALKGGVIATCNHVFIFDCLAIKHALRGRKVRFTVAEFNNRKGFLGEMMRSSGILPITGKLKVVKKFTNAVEHYLLRDNVVVFYPEQAMWYLYDKPRPFKIGAFHYAVKFDVPILPMFITYRNSGKFDKEGLEIKYFTVHILPPIYPDKSLPPKEDAERMKKADYEACCAVYEKVYGKPLVYDVEKQG